MTERGHRSQVTRHSSEDDSEPKPDIQTPEVRSTTIDPNAAELLERRLSDTIDSFTYECAALVRQAYGVEGGPTDLQPVVEDAFVGHLLQRLLVRRGRENTESFVASALSTIELLLTAARDNPDADPFELIEIAARGRPSTESPSSEELS